MARPFLNDWTIGYFSRRFATNNNDIMIARDLHFHDFDAQRVENRTQACGLQPLGAESTSVFGHTLGNSHVTSSRWVSSKRYSNRLICTRLFPIEKKRAIDEEDFKLDMLNGFYVTNYKTNQNNLPFWKDHRLCSWRERHIQSVQSPAFLP